MEHAPTLYSLKTLSHDRRTESPQTESRITTILQILCFNRNQRNGNFFPAVMGLIMHSRGVSKPYSRSSMPWVLQSRMTPLWDQLRDWGAMQ
jgi:hypothetical protein